jgi:hypothetical protein
MNKRYASIKVFFDKCVGAFPNFAEWMRQVLSHRTICENCGCGMQNKKFYPVPLHYNRNVACSSANYAYVCQECAVSICDSKDYYKIVDSFLNLRNFETIHGLQTVRLTPELAAILPKRPVLKASVDADSFRKTPEYYNLVASCKRENCEDCGVAGGFHPLIRKNIMGLKFVSTSNELTLNPKNYKTLCPECAKKINAAKASV